jgi:sugar phosphate isomerase/epimerase
VRFSITTGCCMTARGNNKLLGDVEALKKLHEVGFDTVDFSFVYYEYADFILRADDWEKRIEEVGRVAEELRIKITQCHFPFIMEHLRLSHASEYSEIFDECMHRAYIAAGMLGVRYGVIHPRTYPEFNHEAKACLEANHAYYDKFIELGIKHGVGTAIENQLPFLTRKLATRYCQHYDQLIELVDSYNDPMVGICWDTGHANQMQFDQGRALRAIGHRLKALHINDNKYGTLDEHLLPFIGDCDWDDIIEALVDIGYDGDLTYETGRVGNLAPWGPFQDAFLRATRENGLCMMEMYNAALKRKKAKVW